MAKLGRRVEDVTTRLTYKTVQRAFPLSDKLMLNVKKAYKEAKGTFSAKARAKREDV